jgi:hypothetical protein
MSKRNKKGGKVKSEAIKIGKKAGPDSAGVSATAAVQPTAVSAEAATTANPSRPLKIKVTKTDMVYRGNRQAWYIRLKEFDGKTEGEFIEDTKKTPPSLTRNGTAENPTGWVSFFRRQGVLSLQNAA